MSALPVLGVKFTFTGNTISGSSIITNVSNTENIVIGMEISSPIVEISGQNVSLFPLGATVISVDSETQITMSSVAITSVSISIVMVLAPSL